MNKLNINELTEEVYNYNIIIFGASKAGINAYNKLKEINRVFCIKYYCDNDVKKKDKNVNGIKIITPNMLPDLIKSNYLIVIASMYYEDIQAQLLEINSEYKFVLFEELMSYLVGRSVEKEIQIYNIDYKKMCRNWLNSIESEVYYWDKQFKKIHSNGDYKILKREFKLDRIEEKILCEDIIIVDVGSGPLAKYGNLYKGKEINYIPIDPLAYFYKNLYLKYDIIPPVLTRFGIMENLSLFVDKGKVDLVIIDNALDHSINPVKSLIEAINVLKIGGYVTMGHSENEAIFENNTGLHQWNIFIDSHENLIFFNNNNNINITKLLNDCVEISIKKKTYLSYGRERRWIDINIKKNKEVCNKLIEKYDNLKDTGILVENLFSKLSDCITL